ncbi:hypothetical protein CLAUDI_41 [Bacillus phage Claudi]|uniref:Uncharacterized protein n=1 Tax=Bacillus phage Claudi TaxID=1874001 RepID=A0A1B1PAL1_9CAUD|nr:hypothetical protein MUK67_gp41 [Bacillus phage Claudi]ANT41195.1 hypothetical protein CLAUDI_41 [Bacillus phage Claudi]
MTNFKLFLINEHIINIEGNRFRIESELDEEVCNFNTVSGNIVLVPKNNILYVIEDKPSN